MGNSSRTGTCRRWARAWHRRRPDLLSSFSPAIGGLGSGSPAPSSSCPPQPRSSSCPVGHDGAAGSQVRDGAASACCSRSLLWTPDDTEVVLLVGYPKWKVEM